MAALLRPNKHDWFGIVNAKWADQAPPFPPSLVPSSPEHKALIITAVTMVIILITTTRLQGRSSWSCMWSKTLPRVATSWQKVLTRKAFQPFWSRKWPASLPASTAAMAVPCSTQDWSENFSERSNGCAKNDTQQTEKSQQSATMLLLIMQMLSHSASQQCSNREGRGVG